MPRRWTVKHGDGQFCKSRAAQRMTRAVTTMGKVHTNTIDGYWGCFKNCMRGMKSLRTETQPLFLAEFMWRHNSSVLDPNRSVFERILVLLGSYAHEETIAHQLMRLQFMKSAKQTAQHLRLNCLTYLTTDQLHAPMLHTYIKKEASSRQKI